MVVKDQSDTRQIFQGIFLLKVSTGEPGDPDYFPAFWI
jgi:hypothetical protein